ncbi:unc-13 homolog C-like [Paramuricea clavata]|uniref:Unc-13 homolog C-like n=1 Tax=Paramuricea clavata TaxID=317549 RepID=A0A6S7FT70_PARCT|nr:unc-13 homolog C-like [Paramuricea clavata]
MEDIYQSISMNKRLKKLDKLDMIEERIKGMESNLKDVKHLVEYAHGEIEDMKNANSQKEKTERETMGRLEKLEQKILHYKTAFSKGDSSKPCPIVVKFNRYQQREDVRVNAHKLKGTKIGISEQFPKEIANVRKKPLP